MTESSSFEHPDRIGPYHLVQVIGEGGMGIVYEAEQKEPVRRRVAMKIIKVGMDTKEVMGRFEAERQALAVMEHPGIAKVLDAGATEQGRPYFVMELVRGVRLDEYCDLQRLTTRQRVELFTRVCEAVQHAHQKGVIHRDLKPSNVLVTEEGDRAAPKIIDFGIAKATGQKLTQETVVTTFGQMLGTLAYMSPEQAEMSGLDVDTRADIYSLGVMLHELVGGKVPLDPKELGAPVFFARLIARDETMPTLSKRISALDRVQLDRLAESRRTDPGKLKRELGGDLQWIVLKAMDKDRGRRYETANGLAMDLQRYLAHEPIAARPPTTMYRFRKFARRNRVGVVLTGAVAALVVGFAATMAIQANLISQERDRAQLQATKAEQVSTFLTGLFERSDPTLFPGDTLTARELLRRGVERIDTDLVDQPDLRADLLGVMGDVYRSLGLYEDAGALYESSLEDARSTQGDTSAVAATALANLGTIARFGGRLDDAELLEREALMIRRVLYGDSHLEVAESLNGLGVVLLELGRHEESGDMLGEALKQRLTHFGPETSEVAETLNNLGSVMEDWGKADSAEVLFRQSLTIRRAVHGDGHPVVATALNSLGLLLRDRGDLEGAEPLLREALATRRTLLGETHPLLAPVINNLAGVLRMKGDLEAAEPLYLESLALRRELYGEYHPTVATALNNIALFYRDKGDLEASERHYRDAVDVGREVYAENHPNLAASLRNLGYTLMLRGLPIEAEPLLRESSTMYESSLGENDYRTLRARATLGGSFTARGMYTEAEEILVATYESLVSEHADQVGDLRSTAGYLVQLYEAWGRPDRADEYRSR